MESASNGLNEAATASYPTIAATATALPPYTITREDVKVYMGRVFDIPERRLEAMMSIVDNAQVHNRHSIFPLDYTIEPRPLSQTNNEYIEHAVKLGREAAEKCLERAGLKPTDIDMIITVSCTSFMIPSLGAHLIHLLEFRSNVRRMPFTELGRAAGVMALARARLPRSQRPEARGDQRLDFTARRSAPARNHRDGAGPVQVRHAAVLGHSRERRQFIQRDDAVHPARMAGKKTAPGR